MAIFSSDFKSSVETMFSGKNRLVTTTDQGEYTGYEVNVAGFTKDEVSLKFNKETGELVVKAERSTGDEENGFDPTSQTITLHIDDKPEDVKVTEGLLTFHVKKHDPAEGFETVEIN